MSFSKTALHAGIAGLNAFGRGLGRIGAEPVRLDVAGLRQAAQRRAELMDFGPWDIDAPLERLVEAYRNEADLTLLGRLTVREMLLSLLENLLHLQAQIAHTPSIANEKIEAPVFIIGLPRTGTTLLHGLMNKDPDNRLPLTWEVMFPAGYENEPAAIENIHRKTAVRLAWANRLAPEFKRIHPMAPDLPQECIAITAQVFMSIQFHTTHEVASYEDWLEYDSQKLAYDFHYRLLQHLQARRAASRWVLKAPGHLFALAALLERYPDAKIIQTHRDPLRVMASMASHASVLRRAFSNSADPKTIAADWTNRWARALDNFLSVRDRSPREQFLDIEYEAIEKAPLEAVEEIYRFIGQPLSSVARRNMQDFLAANPKNKHGVHRYSLSQFGLDREKEVARFRDYCDRFEIMVHADP